MPIKVLMFGWELPPNNSGGLGVACYGLTRALSQQNVNITFVLPHRQDVSADFLNLVFADLENFDWPNFSPYITSALTPTKGTKELPVPRDLLTAVKMYALRAREIAKKENFDLIHAHDWLCMPAGLSGSEVSHKPLVSHVHATEFDRAGGHPGNPLVSEIEANGVNRSDAVIAVSQFTKNLLVSRYQSAPDKINVVHNGVDSSEFDYLVDNDPLLALKTAGYKIVLYVGRLTLSKGPDYLLKSAKTVLHFDPNVVFLIVGSGDMEQEVVRMAVDYGISDHVLFAGFLRGQSLKDAFHAADLFVMPSVSEPFGLTALESVASGTPAIVSKTSGVSEALTHVLKVDFWDTDEMANKILSVIKYPALHQSLQDNGRREVKNFSWDAAAAKTINVYKQVLNR